MSTKMYMEGKINYNYNTMKCFNTTPKFNYSSS